MSTLQRALAAVLPERWAKEIEAESRLWIARCPCGHELSVWESGGVRWKAAGKPRRYLPCPQCHCRTWHTLYKRAANAEPKA